LVSTSTVRIIDSPRHIRKSLDCFKGILIQDPCLIVISDENTGWDDTDEWIQIERGCSLEEIQVDGSVGITTWVLVV
jgi:hypothetical protein